MSTISSDPVVLGQSASLKTDTQPGRRGFWALIATQFQGAFSDNILRNLLLSMIVGMSLAKTERETFVSVVTFLFSVPFLIFSMPGGWLADRFSKRQITIWTKVMEFGSMLLATDGLATHIPNFGDVVSNLAVRHHRHLGSGVLARIPIQRRARTFYR